MAKFVKAFTQLLESVTYQGKVINYKNLYSQILMAPACTIIIPQALTASNGFES